jgi:hypothetical protein
MNNLTQLFLNPINNKQYIETQAGILIEVYEVDKDGN